ncbi:hypothetical protein BJV82DRAFT_620656 [Fennellomyces sp. T-0311]|nr:hypothetical protein BJV82DRAFT_620656 [Fennellomyces sp. T-0311]
MLQFITRFPAEITLEIVSYLDQFDCVELMCVCHNWHNIIPTLALRVWNHVYVSRTSWNKTNSCMIRCLSYVQHLTIENRDSVPILSKFRKSAISWLEIKSHDPSLTTDLQLVSSIKPLAATLTELDITDHPSNLSLVDLLEALPNLTHLTFLFDAKRFKQLPPTLGYTKEDDKQLICSKLVYLHLDNAYNFELEMAPLFRRCPQLVSLLLSTQFERVPDRTFEFSIDLCRATKLCPLLRYIMLNQGKYAVQEDHARGDFWKQMSKEGSVDKDGQGIREFIFYGDEFNFNKVLPTLLDQRHTLEYVSLSSVDENPWTLLADIHFERLRTLNMWYAKVEEQAWNRFLTTNGKHLERLDLSLVTNPKHLPPIVKAINSMENLKQLRLFNSSRFCNYPDEFNLGALSRNPELRILDLSNVCVLDQEIIGLCHSQSLLELSVLMNHDHCTCITVDGFLGFADKLKDVNTSICFIWFENCHNITDACLERLAYVESLITLSIYGNRRITDEGVRSFLNVNNDDGKKSIEVHDCPEVSRQGLWTIDDDESDESSSVEYTSC